MKKGWVVRIPSDNPVIPTLKHSHLVMLLVLEWLCRGRDHTWAKNSTLAGLFGSNRRQVQRTLTEMEESGLIHRLEVKPGRRGGARVAVFLRKRLDPARPTMDRQPTRDDVRRNGKAARKGDNSGTVSIGERATIPSRYSDERATNLTYQRATIPARQRATNLTYPSPPHTPLMNKDEYNDSVVVVNKDEVLKKDEHRIGSDFSVSERQRQRPDQPNVGDLQLTSGQREFLERLPAELKPRWDALSDGKRKRILGHHQRACDEALLLIDLGELKRVSIPRPPRPIPGTLPDLITGLAERDCPDEWIQAAAEGLAQEFGSIEDRKLWGELNKIARNVRSGRIEPAHMLEARRMALKPAVKNRGAAFWKNLQRLSGSNASELTEVGK